MDFASIIIGTNYVSTTNAIRMSVYKNTAYNAVVQSITEPSGTHAARTWAFINLERTLHHFQLEELDGSGNVTGIIVPAQNFTPNNQTFEYKKSVLIQAGVTPIPGNTATLWPTGTNSVNVPDWKGWQIESFVYPGGIGELKYTEDSPVDMSWNIATADLTLNGTGIVFQPMEYYLVHFKPKIIQSSGGTGGGTGTMPIKEIKVDTVLSIDDIGSRIILTPTANSITVSLPDSNLVSEGVVTKFEMSSSAQKTVKLITSAGRLINWLEGALGGLYFSPTYQLEIYSHALTSNSEWRVANNEGNFKTVGEFIYDDNIAANVLNKVLLDGATYNVNQYGNLYYRFVNKLPSNQVVAYADWSSNTTKWSYADASGNFHVPDLRNLFLRASDGTLIPGAYFGDKVGNHVHLIAVAGNREGDLTQFSSVNAGKDNGQANAYILSGTAQAPNVGVTGNPGIITIPAGFVPIGATETYPKHRITRIYCRC